MLQGFWRKRRAEFWRVLCWSFFCASCQFPITSPPVWVSPHPTVKTPRPIPIAVHAPDPVMRKLMCEQLEQSLTLRPYTCVVEPSEEKVPRLTVGIELRDPQLDYGRNLGWSTVTAGMLLLVTSSATLVYSFTLEVPGAPTRTLHTQSTGRIGLWIVLPPPKGWLGTFLGTLVNSSGTPDQLRDSCISLKVPKDERIADCQLYRLFLANSLNQIWPQLQTALFADSDLVVSPEDSPDESLLQEESRISSSPDAALTDSSFPDSPWSIPWGPAWHLSLYRGQVVDNSFWELVLKGQHDYRPSYIDTIAISRELSTHLQQIRFEVEGQLGKHSGMQEHWETNLQFVLRWRVLDAPVPVSIAYGDGLSYAEESPRMELAMGEVDTQRLVAYFMVELDIGLPALPLDSKLLFRIHHRSGVLGLYCKKKCGSNFQALGLKVTL